MSEEIRHNLTEEVLAMEYIRVLDAIDRLTTERENLRKEIITLHSAGINFKPFKVQVVETFALDYERCIEVYKTKTGKAAPVRQIPEQIIPAHEELDMEYFKQLLTVEQIKEGEIKYAVKRAVEYKKRGRLYE